MHRCSRCTRLMCHSEERSDVGISGRHWHPTPATMKTVCTDCVCSGGQRPPLAVTGFCAPSPTVQCPQICHCEAPTGPWQSREGSCVFAAAYQLSTIVLRDSHVASLLGMTRQGGAAVHQCSYAVESLCTRRSLSAATDAIGAHHFIDTRYESQALRRERHAAPGAVLPTGAGWR